MGNTPDHVVLGGRSMGGRMCSMAVAEGLPAAGLILIVVPAAPARQARDTSAPPTWLDVARSVRCSSAATGIRSARRTSWPTRWQLVRGPVTSVTIEGAGHDLKGAGSTG